VDAPSDYYTVLPCRVLDTRTGGQPLEAAVPRSIQVAGLCGIPPTAKAAAGNVTVVTGAGMVGYLTLYPGDEGIPSTSTINVGASQTRANSVLLKLDSSGMGALGAVFSVTGAHLIVDVSGYFE
jgi:hypothetical protein